MVVAYPERMMKVLQEFREKFDKSTNRMPVQMFEIFLLVNRKPGLTQTDILNSIGGLSGMSVSRNVSTLADYGLVRQEQKGTALMVFPTPKGEKALSRFNTILEGG